MIVNKNRLLVRDRDAKKNIFLIYFVDIG